MPNSELTFLGAGAVLGPVIRRLAGRRRLRVLSTRPLPPGVERIGWEQLGASRDLLVCGLSIDEQRALQGASSRMALIQANLGVLSRYWHLDGWRDRPVLMVTNPVEMMCHHLWQATGNGRIYGFGIGSDRQRLSEVLSALAGEEQDPGEVSGFHAFAPLFRSEAFDRLLSGSLTGRRSRYSREGCQEASADWRQLLQAWTRTEFDNGRPPTERASDNLVRLLEEWPNVEVSGLTHSAGVPCFVGGRLAEGGFTRPDWLEEHPEWPEALRFYRSRLR